MGPRFGEFCFCSVAYHFCKVDIGVVLGFAQTLGTEYFPAAYDRRLYLLSCFAEQYVKFSDGLPAVAVCDRWRTFTPRTLQNVLSIAARPKPGWKSLLLSRKQQGNTQCREFEQRPVRPLYPPCLTGTFDKVLSHGPVHMKLSCSAYIFILPCPIMPYCWWRFVIV